MSAQSNSYTNKPLVYLDQNILGEPLEAIISADNDKRFRDRIILVYSDDTMAEILRSEGLAARFIDNLEMFQTVRALAELENFKPTGRYLFRVERPRNRIREIIEDGLLAGFDLQGLGILHKFFGGQGEKNFSDIADAQLSAMKENWKLNVEQLGFDQNYQRSLDTIHEALAKMVSSALNHAADQLNAELGSRENSVMDFRRELNIDQQELNSITGKNAIKQIWALLQTSYPQAASMELEDYFGISNTNPLTKKPYTVHEKVRSMMLILNLMGYHSDKRLKNIGKFTASMSDLSHAAWGSQCTDIVSKDARFRKRLRAVYDYLNVPTYIHNLDNNGQFVVERS